RHDVHPRPVHEHVRNQPPEATQPQPPQIIPVHFLHAFPQKSTYSYHVSVTEVKAWRDTHETELARFLSGLTASSRAARPDAARPARQFSSRHQGAARPRASRRSATAPLSRFKQQSPLGAAAPPLSKPLSASAKPQCCPNAGANAARRPRHDCF